MTIWLLVIFLADPRAMPVVEPVENLEACLARAPVAAFVLGREGRAVDHMRCVATRQPPPVTGEVISR